MRGALGSPANGLGRVASSFSLSGAPRSYTAAAALALRATTSTSATRRFMELGVARTVGR
jgi:hypothetical protein